VVLDGEIVCLDEGGRPSLQVLQHRSQQGGPPSARLVRRFPVHYVVFDVLYLGGRSVMEEPLWRRKNLLHDLLRPSEVAQACDFVEGQGRAFFQATCDHGLEGVMAKERNSAYQPGSRSPRWLKVKRVRESDFVIGGYTFGGRREPFSSLLLGLYQGRDLLYVGLVGTGFTEAQQRHLLSLLQELHTPHCPFREPPVVPKFIHWCLPRLVCQVRYGEFTLDGKLRYPVFLALREDKAPEECVVADAPGWPLHLSPRER